LGETATVKELGKKDGMDQTANYRVTGIGEKSFHSVCDMEELIPIPTISGRQRGWGNCAHAKSIGLDKGSPGIFLLGK